MLLLSMVLGLVYSEVSHAERVRGVTVSCHRWGPNEWDGPDMAGTLDAIAEAGGNWVAIHPYAAIGEDGSVGGGRYGTAPESIVTVPVQLAYERGMKLLVNPHLAYWGSRFSWRGAIEFDDAAAIERFWLEYERWNVEQAALAERAGADAYSVGCEMVKITTLANDARWRKVIAAVREVYSGPVTYAANFDEYEQVTFWDALDAIGVQAYFPLTDQGPSHVPDDAELRAGWSSVMVRMRALSQKHGRPVVFTELGYAPTAVSAYEPWTYHRLGDTPSDAARAAALADLKLRCMRIALEALEREPAVVGAFLWKWMPDPPGRSWSHDFMLNYPAMREVLRSVWRAGVLGFADDEKAHVR